MKEYSISKNIDPCKLTREDLEQLVSLILTNFEDTTKKEDSLVIRTKYPGVSISENTLSSFLSHYETPKILTEISISVSGWNHQSNVYKSVDLYLCKNYCSLRVASYDQTWTMGKCSQIADFLKSKRILLWFLKSPIIYILQGAVNMIGVTALSLFVTYWLKRGYNNIPPILIPFLITPPVLIFLLNKYKHTQIILKNDPSFLDKYGDALGLLIALLSLLATLVFGILSLK